MAGEGCHRFVPAFRRDRLCALAWRPDGAKPPPAIERQYRGQGGPLFLRAVAYATDGRLGYIIGGFGLQAGGPDVGKFVLTLRKDESGRWQIMSDMDNGNRQ